MVTSSRSERRVRFQVISGLVVLLCARAIVLPLGIDRLTTVTWMTPVSILISLVLATGASILMGGEFLTPKQTADDLSTKIEKHRVERPLRGIVSVLLIGCVIFFLVGTLLGVIAQHFPGNNYTLRVVVTSIDKNFSARNPCLLKVVASTEGDARELKFCLKTASGGAIGPENLRAGDTVSVRLRATLLGTVVEFAGRAR